MLVNQKKMKKNEKSEKKGLQKVLRGYINSITETKCLDERRSDLKNSKEDKGVGW